MALQQATRRFGPPLGAPGVEVIERPGGNALSDPRYGCIAMFGVLKRGPMGVCIPVNSRNQYDEIFGDPRDPNWHLYADSAHLTPDAIDGFFATGGGAGMVWVTRLDLDKKARKAEIILNNRVGAPALKIMAANEGRWGGSANAIALTPVVAATGRTFTIVAPGVLANEFLGAEVEMTGVPGKRFKIIANTAAFTPSNEVVFTVGAQYNLISEGVAGPVALTGTATYTRYKTLTGAIAFPLFKSLSGLVDSNGVTVTGVDTLFTTELFVGGNVYWQGEARRIESITSDTTLTVSSPFTANDSAFTAQTDNTTVSGTATLFTTEVAVGDTLYVDINGSLQGRVVASITSATSLKLASGWTVVQSAGTQLQIDNFVITGVGTQFATQVSAGQFIVDPNRQGATLKVVDVISATSLKVNGTFSAGFSGARITRQNQKAAVTLSALRIEGLSAEVGNGTRYPDTHFSLTIRFNGSVVQQISDASLDPSDPYFVEPVVNDSNVAFRNGGNNYQKWVTVESLWTSTYTTSADSDVRPCNSTGLIRVLTPTRIYSESPIDAELVLGNLLYPNPYAQARNYFRINGSQAPVILDGTYSSSGVNVTGTSTSFLSQIKSGDYLFDPTSKTARKVRFVASNTALILESAFATSVAALTKGTKLGYMQVSQGYDLTLWCAVGDRYLSVYSQNLIRGYDGNTSTVIPFYFTQYFDLDRNHLENATFRQNLGLIRMATPGISDVVVQRAGCAYAAGKAFEYRGEIPSNYTTAAAAEAFLNQDLGRNDFLVVAFPSYGFISSPFGAGDRLISLSGELMGGESAKSIVNEGYHVPFAGVQAILPRVIKLPFQAHPSDEAIINVAGIHTVKTVFGNTVNFGARSPSISPTYDFTHIRRTQSNFVRIFLEARTLLELLFQPNQPYLVEQVILILNNFARREHKKGVFTQYLSFVQAVQIQGGLGGDNIITDQSSQDAIVSIINGRLHVYFRWVPTGILERLSIHCGPDILVAQYGNSLVQSGT